MKTNNQTRKDIQQKFERIIGNLDDYQKEDTNKSLDIKEVLKRAIAAGEAIGKQDEQANSEAMSPGHSFDRVHS